jgi:hypothetical protein
MHATGKKHSIRFLGFELEGYSWKKLVVHTVIALTTVAGALRQEAIHARQSDLEQKQIDLQARQDQCEKTLSDVLQMLRGSLSPPTMRTSGIGAPSQTTQRLLIPPLPQPSNLERIVESLRADRRQLEKLHAGPQ